LSDLTSKAKKPSQIILGNDCNSEWIPIEEAQKAVREARKETSQINKDNILWWKNKYENSLKQIVEANKILDSYDGDMEVLNQIRKVLT